MSDTPNPSALRLRAAASELMDALRSCRVLEYPDVILLRNVASELVPMLTSEATQGCHQCVGALAQMAITITGFLDSVALNDGENSPSLEILRRLAKHTKRIPVLTKPGDEPYTKKIHERLGFEEVSARGRGRASLGTPLNRALARLMRDFEQLVLLALLVRQHSNIQPLEECLRERRPDLDERQRTELKLLLETVVDYPPFSEESAYKWVRPLVDYILIIDPTLEKTPEFQKVLKNKAVPGRKTTEAEIRSNLYKYVSEYLPKLAPADPLPEPFTS